MRKGSTTHTTTRRHRGETAIPPFAFLSLRDRALFAPIYHFDLRVEEATLSTLESVDLKNLHIRLQRLKTGVSSRIPLWRHNAKLLRSYLRVRQDAGHWLFTGRQGPLKKRQIQTLFTNYTKKAGIKGRSVHGLRHSIAVQLLEAGYGIEYVADHTALVGRKQRGRWFSGQKSGRGISPRLTQR